MANPKVYFKECWQWKRNSKGMWRSCTINVKQGSQWWTQIYSVDASLTFENLAVTVLTAVLTFMIRYINVPRCPTVQSFRQIMIDYISTPDGAQFSTSSAECLETNWIYNKSNPIGSLRTRYVSLETNLNFILPGTEEKKKSTIELPFWVRRTRSRKGGIQKTRKSRWRRAHHSPKGEARKNCHMHMHTRLANTNRWSGKVTKALYGSTPKQARVAIYGHLTVHVYNIC